MVWFRKNSLIHRFVPLLLLAVMLVGQITPVYASTTATTEEGVGSSLYSVTTALTAFASNVVGANTNDKHSDDHDVAKDHRLFELNSGDVGDAGCVIGYGDKTKGFISYIAANETRSVTTSSYGAYLNVGDGGRAYTYARYGRLLNELGIDETGNPAKADGGRAVGGRLLQGFNICASFIPTAFDVSFDILKLLNPFRFLVNTHVNVDYAAQGLNNSGPGTMANPFTGAAQNTAGVQTGNQHGEQFTDGTTTVRQYGGGAQAGLRRVSEITTEIYVAMRNMGMFVVVPFLLAFLIAGLLLTRNTDKWGKIANFAKRFAFIVVGIPMLGLLYTATLDQIHSEVLDNSPSSRIIAASFVDFENWVKIGRLNPPTAGVHLDSNGISDSQPQGQASDDSWRTVRETIYRINYRLGLYDIPSSSGIGFIHGVDTNAGTWDTSGNFVNFGGGSQRKTIFTKLNSLLGVYANGSFYTASAWESNVNSYLSANYRSDLGSSDSTDPASSNKKTIYQMYFDTDEVDDWMNRSADDNATIFNGATGGGDGPEEARWANMRWNIFQNGANIASPATSAGANISYNPSGGWGNGFDPSQHGGLSTVSMYNYLASAFNESNIAVYSAANTTSEYTRLQHYSVNLAGSGFTGILFLINCLVCLGIFVIIGAYYCFGMLIHNLKTGLAMIMAIPGSMLGVLKSIAQVIVYVLNMIIELIGTVFLYTFVTDLVIIFASAVETPIINKISSIPSSSVIGGTFAMGQSSSLIATLAGSKMLFMVALAAVVLGLVGIGYTAIKMHRSVLVAWAYARLRVMRFFTCPEFRPVFDAWVVKRKSLYVWDEIVSDMDDIADAVGDVISGTDEHTTKLERSVIG